jgi:DMSO/TMAO reductase YedYZ molybdopterin-dependent catalytic subunit
VAFEDEPGDANSAVPDQSDGAPVGRRIVLGLLGLGAAGVVGGHWLQNTLAEVLAPVQQHDPTGLTDLIPLGDTFRFYSVTGSVPSPTAASYRLTVSGLVDQSTSYSLADLQALPQTSLVRDFQCVTGWQVPQVHWGGVPLSALLDQAKPSAAATAVRFHSFDGTYTESLPLTAARRSDVIVALRMLGRPVPHAHGGPVRIYAAEMYGYKSTKWLSRIELTHGEVPGYWENRGYDLNGFIKP